MAEQPSGEKTEEPTDKKIRDARKKGQVAKSMDVSSTALLLVLVAYFAIGKGFYTENLMEMLILPTYFYTAPFEDAVVEVGAAMVHKFILLIVPLLGLTAITALLINFIQIGPLLTFEPLKPDIKKINPFEGVKKIFNKKSFIEFLKSIIKTSFLGYLLYLVIKGIIDPLMVIPFAGIDAIFSILGPILKIFVINVLVAYVIIAVADLFFQKKQHIKDLRMTKEEVKREYKEMEGDPLIKSERKQMYQDMVMNDTVQATKKANVLVTNPTHYAVAIFYDEKLLPVPAVIAKGQDHIAQMMIKVAQENNIPIMRDVNLARSLYNEVQTFHYVPSDLLEPIAAVLKWAKEIREGPSQ